MVVIAVLLLIAGGVGIIVVSGSGPNIPTIDASGVHPSVAEGIESAREQVRKNPQSGPLWGSLGLTLWAHEYNIEAQACFQHAGRLDAAEFRWPYYLGHLLYAVDRGAAKREFGEAVARAPQEFLPRIRLAETLLDAGEVTPAQEQVEAALGIEPNNPRALLRMSQCLQIQNRTEAALEYARRANRHAPRHRGVLMLLARLLMASGETEEATEISRAAQSGSHQPSGWDDVLIAEKQYFRLDPYWHAFRADLIMQQGDAIAGTGLLERLVAEHPQSTILRTRLVRALLSSGDIEAARRAVNDAPASADTFELHTSRAVIHLLSSEWHDAERTYRDLLARKPDSAAVCHDLAFVLRQQGRTEAALEMADRSLLLDPASLETKAERIRILFALGRSAKWQQALAQLQQEAPKAEQTIELARELGGELANDE